MPKMKSHSGAKKRFRVSKSGKVKFRRQGRNHNTADKSPKLMTNKRSGSYLASKKQEQAIHTLIQK